MPAFVGEYKRYYKLLMKSLEQVNDEDFFKMLSPSSNSIAIIVKHMSGNLKSRFTDFLTTDGEKPWRNRESEFDVSGLTRAELMTLWDEAWAVLEANVWPLDYDDLAKMVSVRGVPLSVEECLVRSLSHFSYHVGEIVFLAKHFAGENWTYLSIAPGKSDDYNQNPTKEKMT